MAAVRVKDDKVQVNVGDALELLEKHMSKALCDSVYRDQRSSERERKWTLYPLMWLWTLITAKGVHTITEAARKASEGWGGLMEQVAATQQGLSKRGQKLSWIFFMEVFHRVVDSVVQDERVQSRYCQDLLEETRKKWPRVLVLDASKLDPIAKRIQILRKVKDTVLPGMILAIYDLYRGIPRRIHFDADAARSEHQKAMEWLAQEDPEPLRDVLLLGDRLYGTLEFLAKSREKGAWALVRRNRSVKIRVRGGRKLLSRWKMRGLGVTVTDSQVQVGMGAAAQTLRLIRLTGPRGTIEWFTNVLDAKRLTAWEAAEFYLRRWQVERMFATLKCTLDMKSWLLAHPNGVAHQVYGAAMVYVGMRIVQADIGAELEVNPDGLSTAKLFPRLRQAFHDYLVSKVTLERVKAMNPGKQLRLPDPKVMDFCWVNAHDLFVEKREGRGRPRRGKANWKSLRHIKGGSAWLN